ncbi:MAG: hypothetical protein ACRDRH_09925 [Pseudonocardia sp.]
MGLVLLIAAGWGGRWLIHACGTPWSGVTEIDGECVGVTDGSYVFDPELAGVEAKIAEENARVAASGQQAVTLALLNPMTADPTSALSIDAARNALEGAYTAQYRANRGEFGDSNPLIRLVLANEGSHQDQWEPVVHQLAGMVDDAAPLVAVAGLGVSVTQTRLAAEELAARGIPMVGSVATADELNHANIRGFIRVVPPNRKYVESLLIYLQRRPELDSAILVFDSNSDDKANPDIFTRSLRANMSDVMSDLIKFPAQSFTGKTNPGEAVTPSRFAGIVANICAVKPEVVLFGGRRADMPIFLTALGDRVCSDTPMIVATAATELSVVKQREAELREKTITLVYATSTDPSGWANNVPGTPEHFPEFQARFTERGFDSARLTGDTISTHDAVATAARAIRLAASPDSVPKSADVRSQLLNLNNLTPVLGASGRLSFSFRGNQQGDESGNPCDKPIPVLGIASSGSSVATEPIYFTCR